MKILLVPVFCSLSVVAQTQTLICQIQGSGASSPYAGQAVVTSGYITAIYAGTGTYQGFFMEQPGCDSDDNTSNGIFVYHPNTSGFSIGDLVGVSGTVVEYQGVTEISSVTNITPLGSGTVTPTTITLPFGSTDLERYEGMLLRFPGQLTVTDNDDWVQYGEVTVAPDRLRSPTQFVDPNDAVASGTNSTGSGNVAAVNNAASENQRSRVLLDDGRTSSYPDPLPLISPDGTLRCGTILNDLTGVLHYAYSNYRLEPVGSLSVTNAVRPAAPSFSGDLRVASWNVHNYFTTLGTSGATTSAELQRQRTKLIQGLVGLDADAILLCELENNATAWTDLLAGLNAALGGTSYAGVEHAGNGSFTKSVILYRTAVLTPSTPLYWLWTNTFQRAQISQGFTVNANGSEVLLSMVHLHSKLCTGATAEDQDQSDGQGCYNYMRRQQAQELVSHWASIRASSGISAQLVMGDFNSYFQEDPVDAVRAGGLQTTTPDDPANYSFRYLGEFGAIDHAFATPAMYAAVTGSLPWAINADEPENMGYTDADLAFYQPNAYRSSDHDPLVVGLNSDLLSTGVSENAALPPVRFTYDADRASAMWAGPDVSRVELLDMTGRSVRSSFWSSGPQDLSGLPSGAYVWRCMDRTGGPIGTGRFIKP